MKQTFMSSGAPALWAQALVAVTAPLALVFVPPVEGAMLLIPVGHVSAVRFARDHGAMLVRPGPISGSIVVEGLRARLAGDPMMVIALAASPIGCGTFETTS